MCVCGGIIEVTAATLIVGAVIAYTKKKRV